MNLKIGIVVSLITLFLIIILQNTQVVSLRFLFWHISMSQIVLLPLIMLIGLIVGFVVGKIPRDESR